jgi:hypothetical protein
MLLGLEGYPEGKIL